MSSSEIVYWKSYIDLIIEWYLFIHYSYFSRINNWMINLAISVVESYILIQYSSIYFKFIRFSAFSVQHLTNRPLNSNLSTCSTWKNPTNTPKLSHCFGKICYWRKERAREENRLEVESFHIHFPDAILVFLIIGIKGGPWMKKKTRWWGTKLKKERKKIHSIK